LFFADHFGLQAGIRIQIHWSNWNYIQLIRVHFLKLFNRIWNQWNLACFETFLDSKILICFLGRVADPDPDWIRIQSGQWIRIRIRNPGPGGKKWPTKVEKN
jgi:hypothetical protein